MFKKTIAMAMLLTLTLATFQPKKAEAGAVLFAAGLATALIHGSEGYVSEGRRATGTTIAIVGFITAALGAVNYINGVDFLPDPLPMDFVILDANGSAKSDQLTNFLANRYPFVDNFEALSALSNTIATKAAKITPDATGHILVQLTQNEIASALASADITSAQMAKIAGDLK